MRTLKSEDQTKHRLELYKLNLRSTAIKEDIESSAYELGKIRALEWVLDSQK